MGKLRSIKHYLLLDQVHCSMISELGSRLVMQYVLVCEIHASSATEIGNFESSISGQVLGQC